MSEDHTHNTLSHFSLKLFSLVSLNRNPQSTTTKYQPAAVGAPISPSPVSSLSCFSVSALNFLHFQLYQSVVFLRFLCDFSPYSPPQPLLSKIRTGKTTLARKNTNAYQVILKWSIQFINY
ncbi:uncharacterized protein LOC123889945 isoform X2 [Trifolium pratense]|uniref:uncharacterized protein LOC123889945 isoform X2 n=1 Tax=Trifolium pratense TaxID=57577 RepID=UPI001E69196F|nr:uncharacterized protein LOC123889945 isoform X2 [Trifolium pratense]